MVHLKTKLLWWMVGSGLVILGIGIAIIPVFQIGYLEPIEQNHLEGFQISESSIDAQIHIHDTWGILTTSNGNIMTLDMTNPGNPQIDTTLNGNLTIDNAILQENNVVVIDNHTGISRYNISNTNSIQFISKFLTNASIIKAIPTENHLIVLEAPQSILVFNWSMESWTIPWQNFTFEYPLQQMALYNEKIYILDTEWDFHTLSIEQNFVNRTYRISNIESPFEITFTVEDIFIMDSHIYLLSNPAFIKIIEMPLIDNFRFLRDFRIESRSPFSLEKFEDIYVDEIRIDGEIWFQNEFERGLLMTNISNPNRPQPMKTFWGENPIIAFDFTDDYVYGLDSLGTWYTLVRAYNTQIPLIRLTGLSIIFIIGIISSGYGSIVIFRRWRAKTIAFKELLRKNHRSLQIQDYMQKDLTHFRNFVIKVYPRHKKLKLTTKGLALFQDFYEKLMNPETRVMDYTRSRAKLIKYYEKTTIQIAQGVVNDHPLKDWEIHRLVHEADNVILTYLENHLNPNHPVLQRIRNEFTMKIGDSKLLL